MRSKRPKIGSAPGSSRTRVFAVRANQTYACQTFGLGLWSSYALGRMTRRHLRPSETHQRTFSNSRYRSIVDDVGVHFATSLMPRVDNSPSQLGLGVDLFADLLPSGLVAEVADNDLRQLQSALDELQ